MASDKDDTKSKDTREFEFSSTIDSNAKRDWDELAEWFRTAEMCPPGVLYDVMVHDRVNAQALAAWGGMVEINDMDGGWGVNVFFFRDITDFHFAFAFLR
ncbi:extracellular SCP domain-containing protein Pry1 [Histoplasma capsulatum]|uniref:Extracellular SCP domain-containing protein Pry1 n=1 Tax=Ajellomyces capsulatus TaxID=5037 RepID=A0A8A1M4N1_AJECA|nr:extracellular SCP domain-containing protein Pry1 [Histoplasma capsulatum]